VVSGFLAITDVLMSSSTYHSTVDHLYREHHGWLRQWLRRRLNCSEAAADLAHDTYLRVLSRDSVPDPGDARRFLTQIAKGLVIDRYRRETIEKAYLQSLRLRPEPLVPDPALRHSIIETLIEIDTLLGELPVNVRRALLLRQLEGMSYKAIAQQLAVAVASGEEYVGGGLAPWSGAEEADEA
jgi:RNA polymerase sigma-70 factor (ECF subfamily)